jgi:uncharacterized membrane protein YedE/YeeE
MPDIFFNSELALLGGAIIGLSALFMMLFFGRIAGISGIIWNVIQTPISHFSSSGFFLCGIILGAIGVTYISGVEISPIQSNPFTIILAGLLVGYGTKLGSGCTSGHGICGISRFSTRSIIATALFMLSGITTVYVMRHLV